MYNNGMKKFALLPFFLILVFIFACSKEVKRTPEDALIADEALKLVESIRTAYIEKDLGYLGGHFSPTELSEIDRSRKGFDSVELAFTPSWVDIEGDSVRVRVLWIGKWKAGDKISEERGAALFELSGRPLLLDSISIENPFLHR